MSLCLHPGSSYVFFLVVLAYCCELRTTHAFLHESLRQANAIMASFEYSAEVLIDAIKMYPYLYDKRHPSFKDRTKKDRAWAEIGSMFGMSSVLVDKRFKNLRDIFKRKQQDIHEKQRSGAGAADIPTIKWPHFGAMLELMEGESEPVASHITADEANESSPPRPSYAAEPERTPNTAEETDVDTCSNDDASATTSREQPTSKRSCSSRRQRTCEGTSSAGEGTSLEAVAQACMEHFEHIRANRGVIKTEDIGFFALRTDVRLRELPVHIAQDVMHAVELMLYEAEAKLHQSSEAT
ncbi:uncharacterized protein LOC142786386 isoform X2 [Rhipicephalus microplus]|uniref:uncharacterized protein LOC142786386 isoform X2 n=1 Tax=Rhipicephalus microplus TaxID=6941 RepID=UPI003F6AC140